MKTKQRSKFMNQVAVFLLILACLVTATGIPAEAAEKTSVWLPVKQTVKTTARSVSTDDQVFLYSLTAREEENPMPEGSSGGEYMLELAGQRDAEIQIDYTAEGTYTYQFRQVTEEKRPGVTYDEEKYLITVRVKKGSGGGLVSEAAVKKESNGMKAASMDYTNVCGAEAGLPGGSDLPDESGKPGDFQTGDGSGLSADGLEKSGKRGSMELDEEAEETGGDGISGSGNTEAAAAAAGDAGAENGAAPGEAEGNAGENLEELGAEDVPRGLRNTDAWALANLLLAAGTVLCTLVLLLTYLKKEETSREENEESVRRKRNGVPRIVSLVVSIMSVIFFLLTEDVTLPLRMTDQYTWMMAAGFLVQIIDIVYIRMNKKEKKENKAYT